MGDRAFVAVITLPAVVVEAVQRHSGNCAPDEACGLLAGVDGQVTFFYPLTNLAEDSMAYVVDPVGHFGALRHANRHGWELVGVFHSHPNAAAVPSPTDVEGALEPEWFHLILGRDGLRGWQIRGSEVSELSLRTVA